MPDFVQNIISWDHLDLENLSSYTQFPGNPPALFMHIPKTGGRTFQAILANNFSISNLYHVPGDNNQYYRHFASMPPKVRNRIRMILGHIQFKDAIYQQMNSPFYHFTMLRDPVKRVISQYNFAKKHPFSKHRDLILENNISIEEYVSDRKRFGSHNILRSYLFGASPKGMDGVESAKYNLYNNFTFFGLTERYDEMLVFIKSVMKLDDIYYRRVNVTKKSKKAELSKNTINVIKENLKPDLAIYEYAVKMYEIRIRKLGADFLEDVDRFIQINNSFAQADEIESAGDNYKIQ